jgi:formiminotetrahydrofolate cyclodeaminase
VAFQDLTVQELCETVAAQTSAPGGGSVAAIVTAFAASLTAMAARFATEEWEYASGAVAQAVALRACVLPIAV